MNKTSLFFSRKVLLTSFLAVLAGSTIYAIGLHFFVTPIGAYAGGITGFSQLLIQLLSMLGITFVPLGLMTILFNIPVFLFGWLKVEKRFAILSVFAVIYIGLLLSVFESLNLPQITDDRLVNVIFGGVLMGAGGGIALRYGGSLGGLDILLAYISYKSGKSVGVYSMITNACILAGAILLSPNNIEPVLLTVLLFLCTSLVVNQVHTKHKIFTAFIITANPSVLVDQIHVRCGRGATLINGEGSYQKSNRVVIMTVISSYQLYVLKGIVARYDPQAFVNIIPTRDVYGNFTRKKTELPLQ